MIKLLLSCAVLLLGPAVLDAQIETKITANDGSAGDSFGKPVAVSGRLMIVGASFDADVADEAFFLEDAGDFFLDTG